MNVNAFQNFKSPTRKDAYQLIGLIGDEDTCVGFLLSGIGEIVEVGGYVTQPNFLIVDNKTTDEEIENCFIRLVTDKDIAMVFINQSIADRIRRVVDNHASAIPPILELPSKGQPYDFQKDCIMKMARKSGHVEALNIEEQENED